MKHLNNLESLGVFVLNKKCYFIFTTIFSVCIALYTLRLPYSVISKTTTFLLFSQPIFNSNTCALLIPPINQKPISQAQGDILGRDLHYINHVSYPSSHARWGCPCLAICPLLRNVYTEKGTGETEQDDKDWNVWEKQGGYHLTLPMLRGCSFACN